MTVNEAIMAADDMRANAIEDDVKVRWLRQLDEKIARDVMRKEFSAQSYEKDKNQRLLAEETFGNMYVLYIVAMIDFTHEDFATYENTMQAFNNEYDGFAKWYIRNNMPPDSGGFRNGI